MLVKDNKLQHFKICKYILPVKTLFKVDLKI